MDEYNFKAENEFYLTSGIDRISKFASHLDLFRMSQSIPGEIVELGVFKGASLSRWIKFRALFENAFSRKIIGFDTYGKFPEPTEEYEVAKYQEFIEAAGEWSIPLHEMCSTLNDLYLWENVELIKGPIELTVPEYVRENPELIISLLHIDVDLYKPTYAGFEMLYDAVCPGGIIILDDYGVFPGATKAVNEVLAKAKSVYNKMEVLRKLPYSKQITFIIKGSE